MCVVLERGIIVIFCLQPLSSLFPSPAVSSPALSAHSQSRSAPRSVSSPPQPTSRSNHGHQPHTHRRPRPARTGRRRRAVRGQLCHHHCQGTHISHTHAQLLAHTPSSMPTAPAAVACLLAHFPPSMHPVTEPTSLDQRTATACHYTPTASPATVETAVNTPAPHSTLTCQTNHANITRCQCGSCRPCLTSPCVSLHLTFPAPPPKNKQSKHNPAARDAPLALYSPQHTPHLSSPPPTKKNRTLLPVTPCWQR